MNQHGGPLGLIRDIYGAATDPTRWPLVLERLADAHGGRIAGFQLRGRTGHTFKFASFARLDPRLHDAYRAYYAARNPWIRSNQSLHTPGRVLPLERLVPTAELLRTEFYNDFLRPADILHGFGACLFQRDDELFTFSVIRSAAGGPYAETDLKCVHPLVPHLQRAVQINDRLWELQSARDSLADALDCLSHGVIVVERQGRVVFVNRAARAIVAQRDGLHIATDGLVPADYSERQRLRELVGQALRTTAGDGFDAGGAMSVTRPSSKRPFLVLVAPLRLGLEDDETKGGATIFVSDPEERVEPAEAAMRRLYGFSVAEAKVAQGFVRAGSLEQAADELCISRETARWHLKRIYRKTGTGRQAELVKAVISGPLAMKWPLPAAPSFRRFPR
jgi:DNA-binding CsgD family transcriptional regulator/PAS domain-containing protein